MLKDTEADIIRVARECIEIEMKALADLSSQIQDDFVATVRMIFRSRGRLVVTGIGKSAIVGQKIVATMNSTGTPSLFMHAADAIHGDLGMIQTEDVLLCLSKSGETPEIKVLIPLVKSRDIRLIAMTAQAQSYLAQNADHCLLTPVTKEAEPNNLAPTASTTAQMAMGDALAVSLLYLRGFSPSDFARYHPGGALGKQLYLRVRDFYKNNRRPFVRPGDTLQEVLISISSGRMGATVVLDSSDQLMGIITDGDLRRFFEKSSSMNGIGASDLMHSNPRTIHADQMAIEALKVMQELSISQLIVAENKNYLGIIHLHDLIKEGIV